MKKNSEVGTPKKQKWVPQNLTDDQKIANLFKKLKTIKKFLNYHFLDQLLTAYENFFFCMIIENEAFFGSKNLLLLHPC